MAYQDFTYRVLAGDETRLDHLLAKVLKFSRAEVRALMEQETILINGQAETNPAASMQAGDELKLRYDRHRRYKEKPRERSTQGFKIVYNDDDIVVVNKEARLLTVPTDRRESRNLVDLLSEHLYGSQKRRSKVAIVHRLDRDTSGLLVFGHRPEVAESLIRQFAGRKPEREYFAIVAGVVKDETGEIRSYLRSDKSLTQRSADQGELAITHYQVLARYSDATLIKVRLETGRRNQIRAHFSELGHPVLGDDRYEPALARHRAWTYKRLALHARVLGFTHPRDGRVIRFEAEVPREFALFSQAVGRGEA